jgi:hypothetical protein
MTLAGTGHTPDADAGAGAAHAGAAAEAQALIEEARAHARRRRRRIIGVAVICAAALAAGALAATGGFPGSRPGQRHATGRPGAVISLASPPRYFLYAQQSGGAYYWLQIRESATGELVAQPQPQPPDYLPPYSLAATGPRSFVVGMMTPSDCATRFFRLQLDNQGRPGALTPFGPTLPGELTALAASAGGGLIGYAIDKTGCATGGTSLGGYLGVLDLRDGRTRQWTNPFPITQLSMSANGNLLAFTHATGPPLQGGGLQVTGLQVLLLPTDAPPGTVAERSRVVASTAPDLSAEPTVLLSPSGTTFYLCSQPFTRPQPGTSQVVETARIVAYRTATGKPTGVLAAFTASFIPNPDGTDPLTVSCSSMALDTSGRFLLVPYQLSYANPAVYYPGPSDSAAIINTATGARSSWTLQFDGDDGPDAMTIAW